MHVGARQSRICEVMEVVPRQSMCVASRKYHTRDKDVVQHGEVMRIILWHSRNDTGLGGVGILTWCVPAENVTSRDLVRG